IIFILGYIPIRLNNIEVQQSIIGQNAPIMLQYLMSAAMLGLLVSAILSVYLLPYKPFKKSRVKKVFLTIIQWLLFPICMIVFGSVPATEAQTRLLLGKYLGFQVTKKVRN
ncbi:hypothetical protein KKG41_03735, partial [Patescibacteria group bacterium]|nr:hypothetical protein [Patescibacteria group bacterium]